MSPAGPDGLFEETATGSGLMVRLDTRLPSPLPVGRGTAIFCSGACFHRRETIRSIELFVDGVAHTPTAWGMPRLDLFQMMHPHLDLADNGQPARDPRSADDPELRCYRSGFWSTLAIRARARPGTIELALAVQLESGARILAPLGRIEVVEEQPRPVYENFPAAKGTGLIAICLASFNPDEARLRTQIDSLRAQTDENWVCLICDDCSQPERYEQILQMVGKDPRFEVSRSRHNLGPYRNFERALALVPHEADLVALCDQDDRWHPEKLQVLRAALGSAQLVYSDQRLVDADGRVLRETLWRGRRNNHTDLASLLVANSITGAATLFRREIAELARPFPDTPGWQFHDHWLGLVAMAVGDVAYVDRPLYDYVQHGGAILGHGRRSHAQEARAPLRKRLPGPDALRERMRGWRAAYFYGYLPHEVQAQALLARCSAMIPDSKRRILERFIAAARDPLPFAWLAVRPLRMLLGSNETLGTEAELARGIAWRHLIEARTGDRRLPFGAPHDATCPPLDVDTLGHSRLARWRARG
jgi:glycosyltransferase involved in cell wall biosynthesis